MRIAVAGAHRTGKSTLIEALAARLPGYEVVEEPYYALEEEGYELSDPPSQEDYEQQLQRSFELVADAPANAILDRSPLDFIAYLNATGARVAVDDWIDQLRDAMDAIDLVIVTRIEAAIPVGAHEDRALRRAVDEQIEALVLDDALGVVGESLEVRGTVEQRVAQVLIHKETWEPIRGERK
ncbi:MAG TPA: AAA family ATPase [Kofleriaceae bacterium]|jgi:predicted ATPase